MVRFPRFSIACLSTLPSQLKVVGVGRCRIVERHRAVGLAMHELVHKRQTGGTHFIRRSLGDNHALRDEIDVIDDFQRLVHVMRDDDRGQPQRIG